MMVARSEVNRIICDAYNLDKINGIILLDKDTTFITYTSDGTSELKQLLVPKRSLKNNLMSETDREYMLLHLDSVLKYYDDLDSTTNRIDDKVTT